MVGKPSIPNLVHSGLYQIVISADEAGVVIGSRSKYHVTTDNIANTAAARTTQFDLYNAVGSGVIVRLLGIYILPVLTGGNPPDVTWEIIRTNTAGSGGANLTISRFNLDNPLVSALVTARSKPTGGATTEATDALTVHANGPIRGEGDWLIHPGYGVKIDQTTNLGTGTTAYSVMFEI